MSPQVVVFDAVGTLMFPSPSVAEVYQRIGLKRGLSLDQNEIENRFGKALAAVDQASDQDSCSASEALEKQRWRQIVKLVFEELEHTEDCFEELFEHYAQPGAWRTYDDAAPLLTALSTRDLQIAIASNFDARLFQVTEGLDLLAGIQVFPCTMLKYRKPSVMFFHKIREQYGTDANQMLYVGDNLAHDIRPARSAGWNAYHVSRPDRPLTALLTELTTNDQKQIGPFNR